MPAHFLHVFSIAIRFGVSQGGVRIAKKRGRDRFRVSSLVYLGAHLSIRLRIVWRWIIQWNVSIWSIDQLCSKWSLNNIKTGRLRPNRGHPFSFRPFPAPRNCPPFMFTQWPIVLGFSRVIFPHNVIINYRLAGTADGVSRR